MRILYVCQYFPPEVCAPAVRAFELSREWRRAGHDVSVLTGFPNHPEGVIHPDYLRAWRKGFRRESHGGVRVYRTWLYPAANRKLWKRSANYLSFALSAAAAGPWISRNHDVVIATSPQLLVGAAGYVAARAQRLPFVLEVRDLWPESLEAVGVASQHSLLYRALECLAGFLYHHADRIVVDGEWKRNALAALGIPASRVAVIQNGVPEDFCPAPESPQAQRARRELRAEYNLAGKFIAMYCGTLGMAQGLETIVDAAARLRSCRDIIFLLVGEGAEREKIARRALDLGLRNLLCLNKQPRESIPGLLAMSDACLVPLRRSEVFRTAIPSKIFEAMAASKPVILNAEGEARQLLLEAKAGIATPPGDAVALADAVMLLQKSPELARCLGANGRRAALAKYTRRRQAADYMQFLNELIASRVRCLSESATSACNLLPAVPSENDRS
ncbi:MAG: glycosyltransferase family 4 protein [Terriglobia bacterium]